MKRENGFYWVKYMNKWGVAEYVEYNRYSYWLVTGLMYRIESKDLDEIDERRIERL